MLCVQAYREAIDEDLFPWYRFPHYRKEEKILSHLMATGEDISVFDSAEMQSDEDMFRGEYGTNFRPPGLEQNNNWDFVHAKHAPPGLPFPPRLRTYGSTPMTFSQSTASVMKGARPLLPQAMHWATRSGAVEPEDCEHLPVIDDEGREMSLPDSPPATVIPYADLEPVGSTSGSAPATVDRVNTRMDSLVEGVEEEEAQEPQELGTARSLDGSSSTSPEGRRSSEVQESSNENSIVSLPSNVNTPERIMSHKTSDTSLKSSVNSAHA